MHEILDWHQSYRFFGILTEIELLHHLQNVGDVSVLSHLHCGTCMSHNNSTGPSQFSRHKLEGTFSPCICIFHLIAMLQLLFSCERDISDGRLYASKYR